MEKKRSGFTLVELLVVVLIISLLAVVVVPRVFRGLGKTKRDLARSNMSNIESGIEMFMLNCGRYPTDDEGLLVLIEPPDDVEEKWTGPYIKKSQLKDPWDSDYMYIEEGAINIGSYDLVSFGADGAEGGEDDDEDIYNE